MDQGELREVMAPTLKPVSIKIRQHKHKRQKVHQPTPLFALDLLCLALNLFLHSTMSDV